MESCDYWAIVFPKVNIPSSKVYSKCRDWAAKWCVYLLVGVLGQLAPPKVLSMVPCSSDVKSSVHVLRGSRNSEYPNGDFASPPGMTFGTVPNWRLPTSSWVSSSVQSSDLPLGNLGKTITVFERNRTRCLIPFIGSGLATSLMTRTTWIGPVSRASSSCAFTISRLALAASVLSPCVSLPNSVAFVVASAASLSAVVILSDSWERIAASELEDRTSNIVSLTIPPTTRNRPKAAIGYIQLPGFSGNSGSFFLCLRQFLRSKATSHISNMHPIATTIPEIHTPLNHLALMASSPNLMGSGAADDPYMKERSREVRWFLIILLCLGLLTVCGVVYIWMSPKV